MDASLKASVVLEWADGEYPFALRGKEIEELEHICGRVGFGAIYQRLTSGTWFWGDIYHTVRLGLLGGGMGEVEAKRLTEMYIGRNTATVPLANGPNSPEQVAIAIVGAAVMGVSEIKSGEPKAGAT